MLQIENPCLPYIALYLISAGIWSSNTKCATHWRLEEGEVRTVLEDDTFWDKDPIFKTIAYPSWEEDQKREEEIVSKSRGVDGSDFSSPQESSLSRTPALEAERDLNPSVLPAYQQFKSSQLSCGELVNKTEVDDLKGVANRFTHPPYPEPDVELLFRKNEFDTLQIETIEHNLIQAVNSGENKLVLFNQVGNFLRIRGDTYRAIECFRSALTISPNNPDVLLNLARVLLNLDYVDDAILLAKRSLDLQATDQNTWLQHFMLGEILQISGDLERAVGHFQSALEQNPSFYPAILHLKKLGHVHTGYSWNLYTLVIITVLCSTILPYLYFAVIRETTTASETNNNFTYKRGVGFLKNKKYSY